MITFFLGRILGRNPILTPIFSKTHEQFASYSSVSQIHQNRITKDSSSAIGNDDAASLTGLLKSYDFTDHQIAKLFTKFPVNPSYNLTNIKPKLDFFLKVGFSNTQLAKLISSHPRLLESSLENRIKPNIFLLKPFYETQEHLVRAIFSSYMLLRNKLGTNFFPNVITLEKHGVPRNNIIKLGIQHPRTLLAQAKRFKKMVKLVVSKGFNPSSTLFCTGLHVISGVSPLTWKEKVNLYKSLGWSEENVAFAFVRYPSCMLASEMKIKRVMDFFVNKRQCEPSYLAENPVLIKLSLEKRIMPRCLVIDILVKKQLVKKSYVHHYKMSNRDFFERYVRTYQDQAPEVLHAYNSSNNFPCLKNESQIS